jgi:hypothetical protein
VTSWEVYLAITLKLASTIEILATADNLLGKSNLSQFKLESNTKYIIFLYQPILNNFKITQES